MLVYFIFAILGTFMFRNITTGLIISDQFNFKNFIMAMMMVIRMSTGEDWNLIMQDTSNTDGACIPNQTCGYYYSPVYFITY